MKLPTSLKISTFSSLPISRAHPSHLTAAINNSKSPPSVFAKHSNSINCTLTTPSLQVTSPLHKIFQQAQTAFQSALSTTFMDSSPRIATSSHGVNSNIQGDYDLTKKLCRSDPSPKQSLVGKWRECHGANNWEGLLDPLDENLRREIVKYGEFAQATYEAFNSDPNSTSYADCLCNDPNSFFDTVGLKNSGYKVTKYIYATPTTQIPEWLAKIVPPPLKPTKKSSNWIGFVGVSDDLEETKRLGRRDIVIAWRGTITPCEWAENLKTDLKALNLMPFQPGLYNSSGSNQRGLCPKVENGFLSLYTNSSKSSSKSASDQVMEEVQRLVELYKGEELSITVTGHSLGASLALLSAYQIRESLLASNHNIPVTVFSFGGPRVGNLDFKERMEEIGVKTLRIVNTHDLIPKMPGIFLNEWMHRKLFDGLESAGGLKERVYSHVGSELRINHLSSPYLKHNADKSCCHNLEAHLHLVDGFQSSVVPFRSNAKRDHSLVNKTCNFLRDELKVPANWLLLSDHCSTTFSTYVNNI
ncbi:hypothetical protein KI387_030951 [Taxus chinensis]|uniref:Fungal lipase-type domain-containing protein n=1 Tax=Taxus chinensis TaxID=29808 RepID=A0AA38CLW4_TAXCH|nr:hypothetical protein KI387_030951 [Taxus chinensis]